MRFKLAFPSANFGSGLQSNYIEGLVLLVSCFDEVMTRDTTIQGFACCGQDCRPDENNCTVDFERMMNQCYTNIPADQRKLMLEQAPGFVDIVKLRGKLTLEEVTANGILPGATTINRDNLTHIRHWSEVVSMDYVVECYQEEMAAKDPLEIQRRRANALIATADEKRASDQRKADKKALRKAEAIVTKDNEHRRQEALSPRSKKAEKDARDAAKAQTKLIARQDKLNRENREAKELQDARDFLSEIASQNRI